MQRASNNSTLPPGKRAGVCLHLTSLPGNYGIGEIGESALQFIDTIASMQLAVWQILPTGPTAYGDSPYQSLSSFAGNEMLLDVESLVRLNLLKAGDPGPLAGLPRDRVDYGELIPIKNALLATAAGNFEARASSTLKAAFEQFLHANDQQWLHDYALFRVLKNRHELRPWPQWERSFAQRRRTAIKKVADEARSEIEAVKILQFLFHHQWQILHAHALEKGIQLFGDMPIYIALDSADAWSGPENLRIDCGGRLTHVAGVPPDYFSSDGQLWGNPLHDWDHQASNGFAWWIARLRHSLSQVDLVRIDHFRGFESFWSIPAKAKTARKGEWEPGPGSALFEALHIAMGELPIVAEDLGEITPPVEALRDDFGIPGMKVLQFEIVRDEFAIDDIEENCACYTGTHDNDTTLGWYRSGLRGKRGRKSSGKAQKVVLKRCDGKPGTIHHDMIRLAFGSKAQMAIAPMQDFLGLGSEARLNTPGTSRNNWRWRLLPEQLSPELRESVLAMTASSGRRIGD